MRKIKFAQLICSLAVLSVITTIGCQKDGQEPLVPVQSKTYSIAEMKSSLSFDTRIPTDSITFNEVKKTFIVLGRYTYSLEEVTKKHEAVQTLIGGSSK